MCCCIAGRQLRRVRHHLRLPDHGTDHLPGHLRRHRVGVLRGPGDPALHRAFIRVRTGPSTEAAPASQKDHRHRVLHPEHRDSLDRHISVVSIGGERGRGRRKRVLINWLLS